MVTVCYVKCDHCHTNIRCKEEVLVGMQLYTMYFCRCTQGGNRLSKSSAAKAYLTVHTALGTGYCRACKRLTAYRKAKRYGDLFKCKCGQVLEKVLAE